LLLVVMHLIFTWDACVSIFGGDAHVSKKGVRADQSPLFIINHKEIIKVKANNLKNKVEK
jgi:hypothetical protein